MPVRLAEVFLAVSLTAAVPSAMADLITVNAMDFESGKDISQAGLGMRMSIFSTLQPGILPFQHNPVLADPVFHGFASEPVGAFMNSMGLRGLGNMSDVYWCYTRSFCTAIDIAVGLELKFDRPVDFVEIGAHHPADAVAMIAFNSAGEMIASGNAGQGFNFSFNSSNDNQTLSLSRSQADISRVWVGDGLQYGVSVHSVSYTAVPEPSALLLFGIGLVGVAFGARPRNKGVSMSYLA